MLRNLVFVALFILIAGNVWAEETITVCSYGGTYNQGLEEIYGKPFTKATGIKVVFTSFPTYAKMQAQVKSNNIEWDIVEAESRMYARGIKDGIFEPLDLSNISPKDFVEGSVKKYGVGVTFYSYNICYRTDKWPAGKGPKTMKDLWDVNKFPGPRAFKYTAYSTMEAALLADGVDKDRIYPLDVRRGLKKLTELKPNIRVFWKTGGHGQQVFRNGDADLGVFVAGRMLQLAKQGVPVHIEWNQQLVDLDYFTILKGCEHKKAAMKFIVFTTDPKRQAALAEWTNYGVPHKKALQYIPEQKAKMLPTYPENLAKGRFLSGEWYADHEADLERQWEAWKME
ncbi:MAG: ABC transporter substrate-binding protein [Desulfosporosinus sp.]|nr:ABC transporter substrate-binding protein [Desulfosporosinus sp.]